MRQANILPPLEHAAFINIGTSDTDCGRGSNGALDTRRDAAAPLSSQQYIPPHVTGLIVHLTHIQNITL